MKRLPALLLLLCAAFSAQAQRLRFAVVTDTHIGREHAAENLKAAIRSIDADDSVRFVLLLGDISHDGTPKGHRKARRLLARLRKPLYLTTGNHAAKRPERYSSFLRTFGTDRFCFDCEGVRFIGITTGPFEPNRHATLPGEEVRWLAERCAVPQPTIVAAHHTPELVAGGSAVFDGCDTSQIVLWLAGHLHVNKIQETSPGPSVVNISTLDGGRYNLFDIDGGRLRVTTVDPRTGSRTAWHSAELNIKTDNR